MHRHLNILGIRGVPAAHGGFETFAQGLALYLTKRGWTVNIYCQHDSRDCNAPENGTQDVWEGVNRTHIVVDGEGPFATVKFDLACTVNVLRRPGVDLVLGYNTAIFALLQRVSGRTVFMNMDGIEWRRDKWGKLAKVWFWLNEFIGSHFCNPIADHPEIKVHLERHWAKNISVIPYGSEKISDVSVLATEKYDLIPQNYIVSIARIEPENSIFEIVSTFSKKSRPTKLVVLGNFRKDNPYHQSILDSASKDVVFLGAVYDKSLLRSLRFHAKAYIHGHQVGGTNPSLVEALGAGNAVIAHDNRFNRWVAGPFQFYFHDEESLEDCLTAIVANNDARLEIARASSRTLHNANFTLDGIHHQYEQLLSGLQSAQLLEADQSYAKIT